MRKVAVASAAILLLLPAVVILAPAQPAQAQTQTLPENNPALIKAAWKNLPTVTQLNFKERKNGDNSKDASTTNELNMDPRRLNTSATGGEPATGPLLQFRQPDIQTPNGPQNLQPESLAILGVEFNGVTEYPITIEPGSLSLRLPYRVTAGTGDATVTYNVRVNTFYRTATSTEPISRDLITKSITGGQTSTDDEISLSSMTLIGAPFQIPRDSLIFMNVSFEGGLNTATGQAVASGTWSVYTNGVDPQNPDPANPWVSWLTIRSPDAIQVNSWIEDPQGNVKTQWSPGDPQAQRTVRPIFAVKDAWGGNDNPHRNDSSPAGQAQWTANILDPNNRLVPLGANVTNCDGVKGDNSSACMIKYDFTEDRSIRTFQLYKFGSVPQMWNFTTDALPGEYTFRVTGKFPHRDGVDLQSEANTKFTIGGYSVDVKAWPGDRDTHTVLASSTTTFLLNVTNTGSVVDTYTVTGSIQLPVGSDWQIILSGDNLSAGVVTLGAGKYTLVKALVSPPANAVKDQISTAKVRVASASGATSEIQLTTTVTDSKQPGVALLFLRETTKTVIAGNSTEYTVHVWNRGNGFDSFNITITSAVPPKWTITPLSQQVRNVAAGELGEFKIRVASASDVTPGSFITTQIQAQSVSGPVAVADTVLKTTATSVSAFTFTVFDINNPVAIDGAKRYIQMNQSAGLGGGNAVTNGLNRAYFRFTLANTGTTIEDYRVEIISNETDLSDDQNGLWPENPVLVIGANSTDCCWNSRQDDGVLLPVRLAPGEAAAIYMLVKSCDATVAGSCAGSEDADEEGSLFARVKTGVCGNPQCTEFSTNVPTRTIEATVERRLQANDGDLVPAMIFTPEFLNITTVDNKRIMKVVPTETSKFVDPGQTVTFTVLLTDMLPNSVTTNFNLVGAISGGIEGLRARGWAINVTQDNHTRDNATGTQTQVNVRVRAPADAQLLESAPIVLQALAPGLPSPASISLTATVGQKFRSALDIPVAQRSVEIHAGETAPFSLTIRNEGSSKDTFDISATPAPTGWTTSFSQSQATIAPFQNVTVTVFLRSPANVLPGTYGVTVNVASQGDAANASQEVSLQANVISSSGPNDLRFSVDPPATKPVEPAGTVTFLLTITNPSPVPVNTITKQMITPSGWRGTFTEGEAGSTAISVPAGGVKNVSFIVTPPTSVLSGSTGTFLLRSESADNPANWGQTLVNVTITGTVAVAIETPEPVKLIERGSFVLFPVRVRNIGTAPDNFTVAVDDSVLPTNWAVKIQNVTGREVGLVAVPPKGSDVVYVNLSAPPAVPKGTTVDLAFTARASSTAPATATLRAVMHDYGVNISTASDVVRGAPGDRLTVAITVGNTGNGNDLFSLTFESGTLVGFNITLSDPTLNVANGTSNITTMTIDIPRRQDVTVGGEIVVTARSLGAESVNLDEARTVPLQVDILPFVSDDVDDDGLIELAIDEDRSNENGFESFKEMFPRTDPQNIFTTVTDVLKVKAGFNEASFLLDTDEDGRADVFWAPSSTVRTLVAGYPDLNKDGTQEYLFDADGDAKVDKLYDPVTKSLHEVTAKDFAGKGTTQYLIDTDGDGRPDRYFDGVSLVTKVDPAPRRANTYAVDTTGAGKPTKFYNTESGAITDASTETIGDLFTTYWYFGVLFALAVLAGIFVVLRRRRMRVK
ncbi:MAG: hypothetical protein HY556_01835 [Euryarchaeota archaeon]|nr:hypothetical protein [Euryarchaeota archaeon]